MTLVQGGVVMRQMNITLDYAKCYAPLARLPVRIISRYV
jgi:hypothetical protein